MILVTPRLNTIRRAVEAAGGRLPKPVATAVADLDKLTAAIDSTPVPDVEQVQDTIAECMLDGRDPFTDPQVQRMLTAQTLAGASGRLIGHGVHSAGQRRVVKALEANVDAILATLHEGAEKVARTLTEAHRIIGDHDLNDSQVILGMGPDAARAWAEAREAVTTLRTIEQAWAALAELTRFAPMVTDSTLRLADLDLETFEQVGRRAEPWAIVRAGGVIDLADATTIRERAQRISEERHHRQVQAAAAFHGEFRRLRGSAAVGAR